ncbi:MAG: pirin family protein [Polyangiaceae bacterium]
MIRRRDLLKAVPHAALFAAGCGTAEPEPPAVASRPRSVSRVVRAMPTRDGAGVRLSRSIGGRDLPNLDPFLLLDEIRSESASDYIKGFPDHPHRGFETVTYMIDGAMEHRDVLGNHGRLTGGAAQWMTAGHGIIHSEMPKQEQGLLWGFQLWVNLPAKLKMTTPRYQDIAPERIPEVSLAGARTRVVAGSAGGEVGPVEGIVVAPTLLDVTIAAGEKFEIPVEPGHQIFAYVLSGAALLGPDATSPATRADLVILGAGSSVLARANEETRMLLVAGAPIGEPIARRGPFVMNTEDELDRAFSDYQSGHLLMGT